MKLFPNLKLLYAFMLFLSANIIQAGSGGPLSPEQAAYDVNYYDLDLSIDPVAKTIGGSLLCRAEIVNSINTFVLDLEYLFTVDSVQFKKGNDDFSIAAFTHTNNKVSITIPVSVTAGDMIGAKIFYNGAPRIAPNPPWGVGFVWDSTPSGGPWIGVACEDEGGDIWWPCKDHPTDEPDSMSMSFTVPNPLTCVSNGRYLGRIDNGDNTSTFNWFISTPINNYNVTIYAAEYSLIQDTYQSSIGDTIPFYFWVLPGDYNNAINHMDVFLTEFNFLESICGPFPFGMDKHGWAHAPYWGMEHQTIIAYGHNFTLNSWGFDYIHYHELAHEWWGNLITAKDWADIWIHEGLATYTEALYVEHMSGIGSYHSFMEARIPPNNHTHALAPRESMTATQAFDHLNSYWRGASVMHTLRYHLGDDQFFHLLKRWAYIDSTDYDNTNGRLCQILDTDDMKNIAEDVTGVELDPFFEVFFREAEYPTLNVVRGTNEATFTWETETNVPLDVNIPIRVGSEYFTVEMSNGQGSFPVLANELLLIDTKKWILMAPPNIVTSVEEDIAQVTYYSLEQNYPNPFNPKTKIKFSIPNILGTSRDLSLRVYDLLGNEVQTLIDKSLPYGNYEIEFDAREIPSGIYLYRIISGNFSETKKMVLIR